MVRNSCPQCQALLEEMRSAVNEAATITDKAEALTHASEPSKHIDEWRQLRARWEDAQNGC